MFSRCTGTFNRTKVELKFIAEINKALADATFNRTKVELKSKSTTCRCLVLTPLIVPKWN